MEQIRAIQQIVDANKGKILSGVVVDLMKECQKAHNAQPPELYRLTWTRVDSHAHATQDDEDSDAEPIASVKLLHVTQTVIVEAFDMIGHTIPPDEHGDHLCPGALPDNGMMLKRWLNAPKPIVLVDGDYALRIISSIEPFVPKRPRSEDE